MTTEGSNRPDAMLPVPVLRRIDRVCAAFEEAWQQGQRPTVEQFCGDTPEPERSALLRELLLLEVDYRQQGGETPAPEEYHSRFPDHGPLVDTVFGCSPTLARFSAAGPGRFGDYELLEQIARGGMGVVYKARQISLNRVVALKMILAGQLASPEEVERFRSEAKAAANLQHPNIVAIHEVGEIEGQPFFSMEYVEGKSFRDILREGPLPARQAAQYVKTIAEAIHYAHQQGTLHRDLKPANVLIDRTDQPRITDFGLAKQVSGGATLTGTGQVLGTPSYMPPEQAVGNRGEVGPASDVYALGAILYELVTGRPPFHGETPTDTLLQVVNSEPVSLRLLNPKVARDLETICLKCLQKEPRKRYPSAEALAQDLGRFLRDEPILARPVGRAERFRRWCRRRPLVAGLSAAVILALLAGTAISTYFAFQASGRAQDATERLWGAYLAQAQAGRRSGRAGQRLQSLEAIAAAAAIRPSAELRDEAIACMGLVDLRLDGQHKVDYPINVRFAPDLGRYVAYRGVGYVGDLSVRRMEDGRELFTLPNPGRRLGHPVFSPDGRLLAEHYLCGKQAECHVWDLDNRRVVLRVPVSVGTPITSFCPHSRTLAVSAPNGFLHVCDVASGERIQILSTKDLQALSSQPRAANRLRFHPSGRCVAFFPESGEFDRGPSTVDVFDLKTRHVVQSFPHPQGTFDVAWGPDGRLLAVACGDFNVHVWDVETGRLQALLRGHQAEVVATGFNHAGNLLVSTSLDGTLRLWDPMSGKELLQTGSVRHFHFSQDDLRLGYHSGENVGAWQVVRPESRTLYDASAVRKGPWSVDFGLEGRLLAAAGDDGLRLWDLGSGRELACLPLGRTDSAFFEQTGKGLITQGDSGLQRWLIVHDPEGHKIRIGPPTTFAPPTPRHGERPTPLSMQGPSLAVVEDGSRVAVFSLDQDNRKRTVHVQPEVGFVAVSPDARWIAASGLDGTGVRIWRTDRGEPASELTSDARSRPIAFSPDGRWLATSDDREYRLWEAGTWRAGHRIVRTPPSISGALAFSRGASLLAAADTVRGAQLIDLNTGDRLASLELRDPGRISWLAFSPDGSRLAAATENHRIQVWDLRSIRNRLAAMGLDWELPAYAPEDAHDGVTPLSLEFTLRSAENRASFRPTPESQSAESGAAPTVGSSLPVRDLDDWGNIQDWFLAAMAAWAGEDKQRAYEWYTGAADLMRRKAPDDEELVSLRKETAVLLELPSDPVKQRSVLMKYAGSLSFDANDWLAWNVKGLSHSRKGEKDQAVACYSEAIRLAPMLAAIYDNRGKAYAEKGDLDRAIADHSEAIRLVPNRCDSYIHRSIAYTQRGDLDQALADAREAVRLNPRSPQGHHQLAYLCIERGDYDEAVRRYSEVVRLAPTQGLSYNNRASARVAGGDFDQAIADCNEAIRLDPQCALAYKNRAEACRRKGELHKAVADATEAIRIDARLAEAYCTRAMALAGTDQIEKALSDAERASGLVPRSPRKLSQLVLFLATCPDSRLRRTDRAVELASAAARQWPRSPGVLAAQGVAQYRAGHWTEALASLEKSVRSPCFTDCIARLFLAMGYWQLGRKDEARQWYERAVERMEQSRADDEEIACLRSEAAGLLQIHETASGDKERPDEGKGNTTGPSFTRKLDRAQISPPLVGPLP